MTIVYVWHIDTKCKTNDKIKTFSKTVAVTVVGVSMIEATFWNKLATL